MQVIDASSIIHAWDNYPLRQLPGLWQWMAAQIAIGELGIASVAMDEVRRKAPDCASWLKSQGIEQIEVTDAVLQDALRIKGLLGIVGDAYGPRGVGENDILIIGVARAKGAELISDERRQMQRPGRSANRKIPAVCEMNEVSVRCLSFVEFIKRSGVVFR